jgi:hypothetical protein
MKRGLMGRFVLAMCSSLLGVACAGKVPPSVPEGPAPALASSPATVHDVPAMSSFSVSLLNPVGTRLSSPGDSFRARVISPLRTPRGYPLVPIGAVLKGRVVAVDHAPASRLRLKFETLMTTVGPIPLSATLAAVQSNPSFVVHQGQRMEGAYDVTLDGVPAVPMGGSGQSPAVFSHSEIRLAARTQLNVVLVNPIRVDGH